MQINTIDRYTITPASLCLKKNKGEIAFTKERITDKNDDNNRKPEEPTTE